MWVGDVELWLVNNFLGVMARQQQALVEEWRVSVIDTIFSWAEVSRNSQISVGIH